MTEGTLRTCGRGHEFRKSSDCPVCPKCWAGYYEKHGTIGDIPKTSAPALRTLIHEDISSLKQLSKWTEKGLLELHGMGPKAVGILKEAMKEKGLSFTKE